MPRVEQVVRYDPEAVAVGAAVPEDLAMSFLPGLVRQSELQEGSQLRAYVRQTSPIMGSVYDSDDVAIDLSARELTVTIDKVGGTQLLVIGDDDIDVVGVALLVGVLWTLAVWWTFTDWHRLAPTTLKLLPVIFLLFGGFSTLVHGLRWDEERWQKMPAERNHKHPPA